MKVVGTFYSIRNQNHLFCLLYYKMYIIRMQHRVCTLVKKGKKNRKEGDFNKIFLTLVNNKCSSVYMNAGEMDHKICTLDCF